MPEGLYDALVRLIGRRVAITTESGRTRVGTLAAVIDGLAIVASSNAGQTSYIRICQIVEVDTPPFFETF